MLNETTWSENEAIIFGSPSLVVSINQSFAFKSFVVMFFSQPVKKIIIQTMPNYLTLFSFLVPHLCDIILLENLRNKVLVHVAAWTFLV